jgi:hypothetical protein
MKVEAGSLAIFCSASSFSMKLVRSFIDLSIISWLAVISGTSLSFFVFAPYFKVSEFEFELITLLTYRFCSVGLIFSASSGRITGTTLVGLDPSAAFS